MKIVIRHRVFVDRHTCVDTWNEYHVSDKTTKYGDMTQFYKGRYPFMAVPNSDYKIL